MPKEAQLVAYADDLALPEAVANMAFSRVILLNKRKLLRRNVTIEVNGYGL